MDIVSLTESKKGKEPRNQVPRKVWKSEEGFGLIFAPKCRDLAF